MVEDTKTVTLSIESYEFLAANIQRSIEACQDLVDHMQSSKKTVANYKEKIKQYKKLQTELK